MLIGLGEESAPDAHLEATALESFEADILKPSLEKPAAVVFANLKDAAQKSHVSKIAGALKAAFGEACRLVDVAKESDLAQRLGVWATPYVMTFENGRMARGVSGVPDGESALAALLGQQGGDAPSQADVEDRLTGGRDALDRRAWPEAADHFARAIEASPTTAEAWAGLARAMIFAGRPEEAARLLESAPETVARDRTLSAVRALLTLAAEASDAGDISTAQAEAAEAPGDLDLRHALARARMKAGDFDGAIEDLLAIIAAEPGWRNDLARTTLLKVFEALDPTSQAVKNGRRRLSSILFS